jgi:hypothetical protein
MTRITTEQAPSAKPIRVSKALTTDWTTFIDVPDYDVPVVGFGISRRIAPGVAEISSPILVSNYGGFDTTCDIRIIEAARPLVAAQTAADYAVYTSGQNYADGDTITLTNGANVIVTANVGGQVSDFVVDSVVGEPVVAVPEPLEQESSSASGTGFSITVEESNLSTTEGHYYLVKDIPVRTSDTLVYPSNGQFLNTRDRLQIRAANDSVLHATVSFTEGQSEEDDIFF